MSLIFFTLLGPLGKGCSSFGAADVDSGQTNVHLFSKTNIERISLLLHFKLYRLSGLRSLCTNLWAHLKMICCISFTTIDIKTFFFEINASSSAGVLQMQSENSQWRIFGVCCLINCFKSWRACNSLQDVVSMDSSIGVQIIWTEFWFPGFRK